MQHRWRLDLYQLEVLGALFKERSLTKAAHALRSSQPGISKVLARLRIHFEDPLFIRVGHQMEPTPRALELEYPVAAVLEHARLLAREQLPFDPCKSDRTFSFCAVEGGAIKIAPLLISKLIVEAPNIYIRMLNVDADHVLEWLESGSVDFAIGAFPNLPKAIRRQPLWREDYLGVKKKAKRRMTAPSLHEFCAQRHVLVSTHGTGHQDQTIERTIEGTVPAQNIRWRVPSFGAAARLVTHIDAVATIPRSIALTLAAELALETFPVPISLPSVQICQYWHQREDKELGMRWMRNLVAQVFRRAND